MSVSVVCAAGGSWTGVQHSSLCLVGVKLVLSSPVFHHPLALIPWALDFFPCGMEILENPALWSVELHSSSRSFQMMPVPAVRMSWREFSWSVGSMPSQIYITVSVSFFSPHIARWPLEALPKNPGSAIAVRPWILLAFMAFLRTLRT